MRSLFPANIVYETTPLVPKSLSVAETVMMLLSFAAVSEMLTWYMLFENSGALSFLSNTLT